MVLILETTVKCRLQVVAMVDIILKRCVIRISTVSYTHLDVYKRQELKGLTSSDPLAKSNIQISFDQQINIVEVLGYPVLKKLNEPIKAVSYTHLDVYKRQLTDMVRVQFLYIYIG